jgi:ribosomal protein S18 acetylase RimI-like enzyme
MPESPQSIIRPYQPGDRSAVLQIAADTAFFGQPVEAFLEDRRLLCEAFFQYYTDLEPEYSWVASVDDQVVGFLLGSLDFERMRHRLVLEILPGVGAKALVGGYRFGRKTWGYAWGLLQASLHGEVLHPDTHQYPAHLHINVDSAWRGRGLGRRLMHAYQDQLIRLDIPGVYLDTTDHNQAACRLYESLGFQVIDACPARFWTNFIHEPVKLVCYALKLNPAGEENEENNEH